MRVVLVLSALAALGGTAPSLGEPREIPARVVWAKGPRAYVAALDSGAFEPRLRLSFVDRRRTLATGEIDGLLDGTLASVRLASGSLDRVKRLDRLRVLAEEVEPRAWPVLRVGVPAGTRENLAIDCASASITLPFAPELYRVEPAGGAALRGVKLAATGAAAAWPETLVVRPYADAVDQEIALERGDIDVAVFWPGEPSARLRGRSPLLGLRSRGVIALEGAVGAASGDARLAAVNAELFGGDLLPLPGLDSAAVAEEPRFDTAPRAYSVDLALPGHTRIEHFLNGGASLFVRGKPAPVRLTLLDVPASPRDSLATNLGSRGFAPRFALRCPVACALAATDYVRALGPDAFADLVRCAPREARP